MSLVTGADGFAGQHLIAHLLATGREVVGAVKGLPPRLTTLSPEDAARVAWVPFDLEDRESVRSVVLGHRVSEVYHLAAVTSVARSWSDAAVAFRVNAIGTLWLLESLADALRSGFSDPKIVITGSAEVYGASAEERLPLTEDAPLKPLSPYAVSKAVQELLALQCHRAWGCRVVVTRSFNHTGPGQRPPFVAAELADQVARLARAGRRGAIVVGNVEVRRDFSDVRDVVRAYKLLVERGEPGAVYNVCSGVSVSIRELLGLLAQIAGIEVECRVDPSRLRPADVPEFYGSPRALEAATGWRAEIPLRKTLHDLLQHARAEESLDAGVRR
ncbi:MAG: GDP-mannose 4,6-dehydratase [Gemmatimonadetes bacterium]|nr:GDP-mannose 4,6-dehydratase [Gemmatimonadota bacterium]